MSAFSPALLTDLYELTMAQAYFEERMAADAVFSLSVRRLHPVGTTCSRVGSRMCWRFSKRFDSTIRRWHSSILDRNFA